MEFLKANFGKLNGALKEQDMDWLHVNIGYEGSGKSTLGMHICRMVDPTFCVDRIVFSTEQFKEAVIKSKKNQAIMIDEGGLMFFARDFMRTDVKETIKLLTFCRQYNLFVCVNAPGLFVIDKYVREHRIKSLTRVLMRGRVALYNKKKIDRIRRDKVTNKIFYPRPNFKESFPKFEDMELWEDYLEKKRKVLYDAKTNEKWLTTGQVAKKIGLAASTVLNRIKSGELPATRLGKEYRVKLSDLRNRCLR